MLQGLKRRIPHDLRRGAYALSKREVYTRFQNFRRSGGEYSCVSFDQTKSIFIHIPKAAGISICHVLYGNKAAGHQFLTEYELIFSKREFDDFFKFTFVRNPWDRLYSAYAFMQQGGMNADNQAFADKHLSKFDDFEEFVTSWVTPANIRGYLHFMPQCNWLRSYTGKQLAVDFVGRFENLAVDFDYVRQHVTPEATLGHKNKTPNKSDYREVYTPEMIEIVRKVYARDIELLEYEF